MNINSFMFINKKIKLLLIAVVIGVSAACGVNADQRDFEQEALSAPEGITEMTVNGNPVEGGETDPNDWRIAPEFRGLIDVETPAYPNPVNINRTFRINISIAGIQAVNGLYVYAFQPRNSSLIGPLYSEMQILDPGLKTITINPQAFAETGIGTDNLYRIIIYDGNRQIISYGDVKVN